MIDLLIVGGYFVGWALSGTVVARAAAADFRVPVGAAEAAMGSLAGLLWPLFIFPAAIWWLARRETPAERRDRLAIERDEHIRKQAETIRRLEREAGIR